MNLKEILQIKMADIYERFKWCDSKKIQEQKIFDKDYLNIAFDGKYLNYSSLEMFLKGYYSTNTKDIYEFYNCLLKSDKVNLKCLIMTFMY